MLLFGNERIIRQDPRLFGNIVTRLYNLSNSIEMGIRLNGLIPPFLSDDGKDFDLMYMNYIFNNNAFIEFMRVIYDLYEGQNVYILIDQGDYKDFITESLIKLIQQRYGYNSYIINELEDLSVVKESDFSIQGLFNLDQDKERFVLLTTDILKLQAELKKDDGGCCI